MTARKTVRKSAKQMIVQEALQVTWVLKGHLKNAQLSYLRIGALLARVRERKLFAELGHANIEEYAEKRLMLKRSALYKYLQVYDWVAEFHKEWLKPKPKGVIPDLNDVADLIWIERKLAEKGLTKKTRAELMTMRTAALEGRLRDSDLEEWRGRGGRPENALKTFLSKVRTLRRRGAELKDLPADAIIHLDAAIESIRSAVVADRKQPK